MLSKGTHIQLLLVIVLFISIDLSFGQLTREHIDDVFRELESEELTLRFFNALNGDPISSAYVVIEGVGDFISDYEGKVVFSIPPDSSYKVVFMREGFIKSAFKIEIMAATLFFNRFSVSPTLPLGSVRIVLDWDETPNDLDAHLIKQGEYHISYRKMRVSTDGVSRLDRDDTNGFGPETITTNQIDDNAVYRYFVHDYTNRSSNSSRRLSGSKGSIKVYSGSELLNVYNVPQEMTGNYWHVFNIINGQIAPVNNILNTLPSQ
ncbi:MAG: hypothetical protein P9X24_00955 [Candidatus Hatepunaea meridiana]|nr:hypothetical protein [Candidatus Hatepunaea meridiana]